MCSSAETPAEVILDKDDTAGNTDDGAADSSKNAESNMDVVTDAGILTYANIYKCR